MYLIQYRRKNIGRIRQNKFCIDVDCNILDVTGQELVKVLRRHRISQSHSQNGERPCRHGGAYSPPVEAGVNNNNTFNTLALHLNEINRVLQQLQH